MQTHSEFSEKPIALKADRQTYCSVSSEVSSKFIIMDYRTLFKKVLERLCSIPTDRQLNCQIYITYSIKIYIYIYIKIVANF